MVKLENKLQTKRNKIGILGGTFDPAHRGHLEISKQAKKRFGLKNIVWAITKKNPFKGESKSSLKDRMQLAKKLIVKNDYIKIKFYEEKIGSNKTFDLIRHLGKDKKFEIFFIMGADNLINFHRWHKSELIAQKCNIIVFDRHGFKKNSLKSKTFKKLNNKTLTFVEFKKVNISSSQLRKI